jgi:3-methyladenine DNA glycosylase AlkD
MKIESALNDLKALFAANSNPERAAKMSAYMRNQHDFIGLISPQRKELIKELRKEHYPKSNHVLHSWVKLLWEQTEREYQYVAMDYLDQYGRLLKDEDIILFDYLIENKSWWDTIDITCGNYLGEFFKTRPELFQFTLKRYIYHDYFWFNRAAIICQLCYKKETNTDYLTQAILTHTESKEFFIQKAIGWALRQYARTNPDWVLAFVKKHQLKPLSVREALKHLKK